MFAFELRHPVVPLLQLVQLAPERVAPRDDLAERRPVLALQAIEKGQPLLDLLQAGRRRFDAVGVPPQEQREILELRLDAVARVQVGLKLRVERRQLRHAAPDMAEARQNRFVAFVQRRIALLAQPLHALGARQHLTQSRQLDIFARFVRLSRLRPASCPLPPFLP